MVYDYRVSWAVRRTCIIVVLSLFVLLLLLWERIAVPCFFVALHLALILEGTALFFHLQTYRLYITHEELVEQHCFNTTTIPIQNLFALVEDEDTWVVLGDGKCIFLPKPVTHQKEAIAYLKKQVPPHPSPIPRSPPAWLRMYQPGFSALLRRGFYCLRIAVPGLLGFLGVGIGIAYSNLTLAMPSQLYSHFAFYAALCGWLLLGNILWKGFSGSFREAIGIGVQYGWKPLLWWTLEDAILADRPNLVVFVTRYLLQHLNPADMAWMPRSLRHLLYAYLIIADYSWSMEILQALVRLKDKEALSHIRAIAEGKVRGKRGATVRRAARRALRTLERQ